MKKLNLKLPIMNASGILSYLPVFEYLEQLETNVGAWVTKSVGPKEKQGNLNPTVYWNGNVLMNSFALPSMSPEDFEEELKQYNGKTPLIISYYGSCPDDYAKNVARFDSHCIAHEVNISCPNFEPGEKSVLESATPVPIVESIRNETGKPVIAKLSPSENYIEIAKAIAPFVDYVSCGNTIARGLEIEPISGHAYLAGKFGGLSGDAIRPISTRMVYEINQALGDQIGIIACGGISKPEHIVSYARAGASLFQIGTALRRKKSKQVSEFFNELWTGVEKMLVEDIKVKSLDDIVGENYVG